MNRKISENGLALIKRFEGLRLTAYQDSVGVWTIGYGHTSGVSEGQTITQTQADAYLRKRRESRKPLYGRLPVEPEPVRRPRQLYL